MRVLVAEDNEDLRLLVELMLQSAGHTCALVGSGREAWELLNRQGEKFDLIVSDNSMPEMTGVELLRRVRADARIAGIRFVLTSGDIVISRNDPTPLEAVCTQNAALFLQKPFAFERFLTALGPPRE